MRDEDNYGKSIQVECPYKHCSAGEGAKCHTQVEVNDLTHEQRGGKIKDEPHVARRRKADDELETTAQEKREEKRDERLIAELKESLGEA
jgi:hypothetical protein